ncbi:MAG TPA: glycosyltransferase [Bacteroidia bacterium]|nr:glycosyltransferase [Bacteroidia bacterium]
MNEPTFSIILPLYKQINHIENIYDTYTKNLATLGETWELLFVINGPDDGSFQKLTQLKNNDNVKIFRLEQGGWGRAVKFGLANATGKHLCYTNSARTEISDLLMILNYAKVNNDNLVKATRIIREKLTRKIGSILYNLECRILFKVPVWDVNGTPKVIPQKVYKQLNIQSDDDLIDAEIVALCAKKNVRIIEIPVVSTKRISGKSTTNYGSAFKMYTGLFKLKNKI